jgi:RNA polymerase sigma-70 factor (ECF subfamily)
LINALERFADYLQILEEEVENDDVTVMDLVQKLPEKQKEVLLLRIKAELKISEIAEVLNIPEGTVKSRVNKGLKFLRAHVEGR